MDVRNRSIIVIGTGAVGGIIAARLAQAGYNVEAVCKHDSYADIASGRGLRVTQGKSSFTQIVKAYERVEDIQQTRDYIFLAVKATDLEDVVRRMKHLIGQDTVVVALQNGIVEYDLGNKVGKNRLVSSIVGWGATMNQPGILEMTSKGEFVIGSFEKESEIYLEQLAEILGNIAPVRISRNITGDKYSKLIINSCITSLGAVSGLYLGEMLRKRKARILFIEIMREAMELAYIMKIKVEPYGEKLDYYEFLGRKGRMASFSRHLTIRLLGFRYRRLKSSSLQSLEKGKITEIDHLNGFIASNGKEFGIPVPVNSEIVKMIHEIEDGKRKIGPENFDEKVFSEYYQ